MFCFWNKLSVYDDLKCKIYDKVLAPRVYAQKVPFFDIEEN